MRNSTRDIVYGGLSSAIVICCLMLGIYIRSSRFFFMAAATYIGSIPYITGGTKAGLLSFAAVSFLSLFILPDRLYAIIYIIVGIYPFIKSLSERRYGKKCEYIIKYIWVNVAMLIIYFLAKCFTAIDLFNNKAVFIAAGIAVIQVAFYIYDYIFTLFVSFFTKKIKKIGDGY